MMTESNSGPQAQQSVLQGSTTANTENNEVETSQVSISDDSATLADSKDGKQERSSISVLFTDWVPADASTIQRSEENFAPGFGGKRPRYFQVHSGHGKIRPGLGTNPEDYVPKVKSRKRKKPPMHLLFDGSGSFNKKFIITPEKPATAILNEINPNLQYNYQELKTEGCKSMPSFTCTIIFPPENGEEFTGEGRSKKLAKNDAAEKVLSNLGVLIPPKPELLIPPNPSLTTTESVSESGTLNLPQNSIPMGFQFPQHIPMHTNDFDFSSDDIINVNFTTPTISQPMVDAAVFRRLRNIPNFEENICLALNTIVLPNTLEYEYLGEEGLPHEKIFTVKLHCNMQEYLGQGGSKKKAKADAAKKAVVTLLGEDCYRMMVNSSQQVSLQNQPTSAESKTKTGKRKKKTRQTNNVMLVTDQDQNAPEESMGEDDDDEDDENDSGEYDLNFSDHISNLVREKYEELMGKDANFSSYKVLAGVVLTIGSPMIYNSRVIAVTTGTKCIEGDFMSPQGLSVNDCHAEILATRCVRDYLYAQIERFESSKSDNDNGLECIIEENSSPERQFKYQLKCNVKFHLYISTSPCGDARIFSPKGIELEEDLEPSLTDLEDTHPNKLNRGVLRSKIEAGEGTIPSANLYSDFISTGPQTWDSIVSGNALYTMSCSDKVCRWNVLGIQGALLYNFFGTLFYSSITLGSLHHPVHFKRAVYGRVEALNTRLDIPFHVNKPKLMMVSREEKRRVKKSPNHAICWSIDWSTPEILAANKGRCDGGTPSRLTKRVAFTRFLQLYNNQSGRRENYMDMTYHDAKQIAPEYQKAKKEFVDFFQDSKLGPWIGKPLEQDSFKIK